LRLAYADPPYVGEGDRYDHPEAARWNDPAEHVALIAELHSGFDGWALSAKSNSLRDLLPAAPSGTRVAAWVKPFCAYKRNVRIAYAWEPVIFLPARDSSKLGAPVGRDFLSEPIVTGRGLIGAKPLPFCEWVLDLLGYAPGDEVVDLFPGTGVMKLALSQGRLDLWANEAVIAIDEPLWPIQERRARPAAPCGPPRHPGHTGTTTEP
jgi:hypothetical protein